MSNYLTYPMKTMRITQNYDGTTSHKPHQPDEFPIDEGGQDTGRDTFFCPCDEMEVKRIYGVKNKGTNTLWLTSTKKCDLANGKSEVVTILITHPNDDDLSKLKVGQKFKRGQAVIKEGKDGASGNHLHIAVGLGEISSNGWKQNKNKKWVLTTNGGAIKPEQAFFVDKAFTTIKGSQGLKFKDKPKESNSTTQKKTAQKTAYIANYRVNCELLNVRTEPNGKIKSFSEFSQNAQEKIKKLYGKKVSNFVRGLTFSTLEEKTVGGQKWGKSPSGWVCLEFCKKL